MIFSEHYECMPRENLRKVQSERLIATVERVYENVPFYRKKMQEVGLEVGDIKGIEDLDKLPFTTKQDLRDHYPFGLFAVPTSEIVRLHASSGTTGKPTVVGYTKQDLEVWSEVVSRSLGCIGATREDYLQVAYGYGLFTGGLGMHYGGERSEITVIPSSTGNTKKQVQLMQDFGSTLLACTPSYALHIADYLDRSNIDIDSLKLRAGIMGAEPWTNGMRKVIEERLKIKAYDIYGLSEIIGPGVACECTYQEGLHINEDHFIPEIIHPETSKSLPAGKKGELVFTTITKEGLPLIRYRTHDLTTLDESICECGRSLVRMDKCNGRTDDMLIIRGINVFPSQIESVLMEIDHVAPHYAITVDRINNIDILEVSVELNKSIGSIDEDGKRVIKSKIESDLKSYLNVSATVHLLEYETLERSEGKSKRVTDKRLYA